MHVRVLKLGQHFPPLIAHSHNSLMKASQHDEYIRIPRRTRWNPSGFLVGWQSLKTSARDNILYKINSYIYNYKTKPFG